MRKPKIYLETTIFNYYFDADRDAHTDTVKLFQEIRVGKYEAYTSAYVMDELIESDEPKRSNMLALIYEYNVTILPVSGEAGKLADVYLKEGVIPVKHRYDALHIAAAAINDLEYVFSLNFRHINKLKTKIMTGNINIIEGYKPVSICSPMEVIEHEEK